MNIEIDLTTVSLSQFNNFTLIDVREEYEREMQPIDNPSVHIPLSQFDGNLTALSKDKQYLVICAHGMRSYGFTQYLRDNGFNEVYSIPQGMESLYQFKTRHSPKQL